MKLIKKYRTEILILSISCIACFFMFSMTNETSKTYEEMFSLKKLDLNNEKEVEKFYKDTFGVFMASEFDGKKYNKKSPINIDGLVLLEKKTFLKAVEYNFDYGVLHLTIKPYLLPATRENIPYNISKDGSTLLLYYANNSKELFYKEIPIEIKPEPKSLLFNGEKYVHNYNEDATKFLAKLPFDKTLKGREEVIETERKKYKDSINRVIDLLYKDKS